MASSTPVVRWGIIGAGDIAHRVMAPAMRASPHAELVAAMRTTMAGAEEFAREHGARRAYDSVEALCRDPDVDAVYVATPVDRHLPDTEMAARHGKHVLCEKPMALTTAEGERMRDACATAGVLFAMCFYQRLNLRHQKVKQLVAEGRIGQVTSVRMNFGGRVRDDRERGAWRLDPAKGGGGSYMDTGSHCVDLLRHIVGEVTAVTGFADTLVSRYRVEDTATSVLKLANGAHAVITTHWSVDDPDERRTSRLEVGGSEGFIITEPLHDKFSRGRLVVVTRQGEESFEFERSTHEMVCEDFAEAVGTGRPPVSTVDDGVRSMQVIEALYESSRTGRTIELD